MHDAPVNDTTIAALALGVSVAVAVWQFTQYLLEGARVRVRLRPGLLDDFSLRQSVRKWSTMSDYAERSGRWHLEVAIMEIENISRFPLTMSDPSLDLGRSRWHRLGRRTIGPRPLDAPDATKERTVRLEPFDRCLYVFDVWRVIVSVSEDNEMPMRIPGAVRGSVRVAGRRGRMRSPWLWRWPVQEGQVTFLRNQPTLELVAWRALFRHLPRSKEDGSSLISEVMVARTLASEFPLSGTAPTRHDVARVLSDSTPWDEEDEALGGPMAAYRVANEVAPLYAPVSATAPTVPAHEHGDA